MGAALAGHLVAQSPVRLSAATPFLRDPGGVRLATLVPGLRLTPGRISGAYVEVTVSGWIFTASTRSDRRDGFALSVSATDGENLRAAPDGAVLGRVVEGALFNRLGTRGGWTQVRRSGWIARNAIVASRGQGESSRAQRSDPAGPIASAAPQPRNDTVARSFAQAPAESSRAQRSDPPARRAALKPGTVLQRTPEGEVITTLSGSAVVSVGERDRDWVKVSLEAWVRQSEVQGAAAPLPQITAAMLREHPDRYIGQAVDWRLQFLARQTADELRPEMPLGHAYLLTRGPLPETGFVYVLVSKAQADALQGLKPLDEIEATVTVRTARTRYLATPVVELIRIGSGR